MFVATITVYLNDITKFYINNMPTNINIIYGYAFTGSQEVIMSNLYYYLYLVEQARYNYIINKNQRLTIAITEIIRKLLVENNVYKIYDSYYDLALLLSLENNTFIPIMENYSVSKYIDNISNKYNVSFRDKNFINKTVNTNTYYIIKIIHFLSTAEKHINYPILDINVTTESIFIHIPRNYSKGISFQDIIIKLNDVLYVEYYIAHLLEISLKVFIQIFEDSIAIVQPII